MKVAGSLQILGSVKAERGTVPLTSFPLNCVVNTTINVNGIIYRCVSNTTGNNAVFTNMAAKVVTYLHSQLVSSKVWTITHNLNTSHPLIQCHDSSMHLLTYSSAVETSSNVLTITMSANKVGTCFIVALD